MSKLNPRGADVAGNVVAVAKKTERKLAVSANGNLQFAKDEAQRLYELTVTAMFGRGGVGEQPVELIQQTRSLVKKLITGGNKDFVANLAIHARTDMNIRTMPVILVVEFAKAIADVRQAHQVEINDLLVGRQTVAKKKQIADLRVAQEESGYVHMRKLVCDVIQRADQITDLYSYALTVFGGKKNMPMAIKRGVADAFNKFNEYAFAKYNRAGAVKMRDVLRIVHPVAKNETQGDVFSRIMKDELRIPYTWETELSTNGQLPEGERKSNKQLWTELVSSGKIGYMALLRNLRNIIQAGLDDSVIREHVVNVIADPERVAKSKQLPYDFMEAYNIVKTLGNSAITSAVSRAVDLSVTNIPSMGERVWIIVDYSASMGKGETSAFGGGVFLASALLKANTDASKLAVTIFGSDAKTLKGIDTNNSMAGIQRELTDYRQGAIAGSTNFHAALKQYNSLGFKPDTIIVITDGEVNGFPYRSLVNIKADMKMTVNMSRAFSTPMIKSDGWHTLAGWNTSMFRWVPSMRDKVSAVEALAGPYKGLPERVAKA